MEDLAKYFTGTNVPTAPVFQLDHPIGLPNENWLAISSILQRLNTATAAQDLPLVIGCAKELVESVAKIVVEVKGQTLPSKAEFSEVINAAHNALERQPGDGLTQDSAVRNVSQGVKKIVNMLPEIRNRYGTGHGRATAPNVPDELALVAMDAAMLWTRWALRRMGLMIIGRPENLITALESETFYSGVLANRLELANLKTLSKDDQRLIGLHVARRAMRDTYLAMSEGVEACTQSTDLERWPLSYRQGLLDGLVMTEDGLLNPSEWSIRQVATMLQSTTEIHADFVDLVEKTQHASYGNQLDNDDKRNKLLKVIESLIRYAPEDTRQAWQALQQRLEIPF